MPKRTSYMPGRCEAVVEADELGARRGARAERLVGLGAVQGDEGDVAERLDVVDDGRLAVVAALGRERRARRDRAAEALQRRQQRGLLADHVRAGALHDLDLEVAELAAGALDRLAQGRRRERVLRAHQHVAVAGADGVAGERHALEQQLRVALHQQLVDVRARVALVAVDDDRPVRVGGARGELPLGAGREAGAAAAAHVGLLDLARAARSGDSESRAWRRPSKRAALAAAPARRARSRPRARSAWRSAAGEHPVDHVRRRRPPRRPRARPPPCGRSRGRRSRPATPTRPRRARPARGRAPRRPRPRARRSRTPSRPCRCRPSRAAGRAAGPGRRRRSRRRRRSPPADPTAPPPGGGRRRVISPRSSIASLSTSSAVGRASLSCARRMSVRLRDIRTARRSSPRRRCRRSAPPAPCPAPASAGCLRTAAPASRRPCRRACRAPGA